MSTSIENNNNPNFIRARLPNNCKRYDYPSCFEHLNICSPRNGRKRRPSCAARSGYASRPLTADEYQRLTENKLNEIDPNLLISSIRDSKGRLRQTYYDPRYHHPANIVINSENPSQLSLPPRELSVGVGKQHGNFDLGDTKRKRKRNQEEEEPEEPNEEEANVKIFSQVTGDDWRRLNQNMENCTSKEFDNIRSNLLRANAHEHSKTIPPAFYAPGNSKLACDAIELLNGIDLGMPSYSQDPSQYEKYSPIITEWWRTQEAENENDNDDHSELEYKQELSSSHLENETKTVSVTGDDWKKFKTNFEKCTSGEFDDIRPNVLRATAIEFDRKVPKAFYEPQNAKLACQAIEILNGIGERMPSYSQDPSRFENYSPIVTEWWRSQVDDNISDAELQHYKGKKRFGPYDNYNKNVKILFDNGKLQKSVCENVNNDIVKSNVLFWDAYLNRKVIPEEFYLPENSKLACEAIELFNDLNAQTSSEELSRNYSHDIVDWWKNQR